jgi:Carboxypeptidase regulatory-like domain
MMAHAVRNKGGIVLLPLLALTLAIFLPGTAAASTNYGQLSGVVLGPGGTPQMGATVKLVAENLTDTTPAQLFTNQNGAFNGARVAAGFYEVRVTLIGYLPAIQKHVHVLPNLTTIVRVEMTTLFASLDRLRHAPTQATNTTDWKSVLRASSATRPVLEWTDARLNSNLREESVARHAHGDLEMTSGSTQPGSISNLPEAPATAFSYDQPIGTEGRLLFAGQVSYGHELPAGGFATAWMPSGDAPNGSVTEVVIRQAWLGPSGLIFRGERLSQRNTLAIGDSAVLRYGADVLAAQIGGSTESIRPVVALAVLISPEWQANFIVASGTAANTTSSGPSSDRAMADLNAFPVLMLRSGRPELEGGWHEEANVRYRLSTQNSVEVAAFHDQSRDTPVFGSGSPANSDYLQDPFSSAFVYDAGPTESSGVRVAFKQKLGDNFDFAAVYAFAGALAPGSENVAASSFLRDSLNMKYRHSVGARFSGHVRHSGTEFHAGYKWIGGGPALTHQDSYGEAFYDLDPYLSVGVRQPLPGSVWNCRWEFMADVRNLLAQGYVPVTTQDGSVVLVSTSRSFRGGLSFQF